MKFKVVGEVDMTKEPCLGCGKTVRADYSGYCMDCADLNGLSELYTQEERQKNLNRLQNGVLSDVEQEGNLRSLGKRIIRKLTE
jgi:hypothetical protein